MELKKDIEKLQTLISKYKQIENSNNNDHKVVLTVGYEELNAIDTVLEEFNNIESKKKNGTLSSVFLSERAITV